MSYTDPQIGTLTLSGDPARFVATERVPVSGLSMDFEPVQDLHGYEYPWPAGGRKNKIVFPYESHDGVIGGVTFRTDSDGKITAEGTTITGMNFFLSRQALKAGTYTLSIKGNHSGVATRVYNSTGGTQIAVINSGSEDDYTTFTLKSDVDTAVIYFNQGLTNRQIKINAYIQLEEGSTPTSYAPYSNICPITGRDSVTVYVSPEPRVVDGTEEYEIEFGQTVYAGTLTINEDGSGQIVSKMASVDLGTLTWRTYTTSGITYFYTSDLSSVAKVPASETTRANIISDKYRNGSIGMLQTVDKFMWLYTNDNLCIKDTSYTDTSAFKASLSGSQLVYELKEPVTIQLDPTEITTLIGLNYVWTSDHNLITISFPYNKEVQPMTPNYEHCWTYPKAYIDRLEARIAALEEAVEDLEEAADAKTAAAPDERNETVAEEITVTEEPETEPVTKKGGK